MADFPGGANRLPNLDGLRAFSVLLVLMFHSQFLGVTGGYLGVSVFFTISGYLLTDRLLSRPIDSTAVARYWNGRFRRILPAAWTVLLLIVAYEWADDRVPLHPTRRLFMHAFGLANWFQLDVGGSYAALFQQADAMVHYWSLAIEQQVYLVLPLVLWGTARLRGRRLQLPVVLVMLAVSFSLPFLTGMSVARTYYGTDTRAGEILAGVALAIAHHHGLLRRRMEPRAGSLLAGGALAGLVALSLVVGPGDDLVRRGLLPAVAVLSTLLIHSAVSVRRLLGGAFELAPVRFIGGISYPIYLLHWPIIVALERLEPAASIRFVVATGGSIALGWPLTRFVERPLRSPAARGRWRVWLATVSLALTGIGLTLQPERTTEFLADLERDGSELNTPTTQAPGAGPSTTLPPEVAAPRVTVFGDSVAMSIGLAAAYHLPESQVLMVQDSTTLGCGVIPEFNAEMCGQVFANWTRVLADTPTDLAILVSCQWELVERNLPGIGDQVIGQPEMDGLVREGYEEAVRTLLEGGAGRVALVLCPPMSLQVGVPADSWGSESRDPARVQRLNQIITDVAATHPRDVTLIDLAAWMAPYVDDATIRPDGSHFGYEQRTMFTDELLTIFAPAIDDARADMRAAATAPTTSPTTSPTASPTIVGAGSVAGSSVAVFGDAHALAVAISVQRFVDDIRYVGGHTSLHCGLVAASSADPCAGVLSEWRQSLAGRSVDVAVVLSCQAELLGVTTPDGSYLPVGSTAADAVVASAFRGAIDELLDAGANTVVLMTCPDFHSDLDPNITAEYAASRQPERVAALNRVIRSLPGEYPQTVAVLDLHAWMAPRVTDSTLRPDGAHFATDVATDFSRAFPTLLASALSTLAAQ